MGDKQATDWEVIEREFRAGVKPLRDIGAEHGVSHTAITKRANKHGWTRDLNAKIRAKADLLVSKEAVSKEVAMETKIAEQEIVEANAVLQATIRREHRRDISRSRKLVITLLEELETQTGGIELLHELGDLINAPDPEDTEALRAIKQKRMDAYHKVISLSGRTGTMKSLTDSLKTLVGLEREAFGIDSRFDDEGTKPPENTDNLELARRLAFILQSGANKAAKATA